MQGLRLSLRRYVLVTLLLIGAVIITVFSTLSANNFFEGMDGMLRGTMISAGRTTDVSAGQPARLLNFTIAAQWQDLPAEVQTHFDEADIQPYHLHKYLDRDFIFTAPNEGVFVTKVPVDEQTYRYVAQVLRMPKERGRGFFITHETWNMLFGLAALCVFAVVLFALLRTVSGPVEALRNWAAQLNESTLDKPIPTFRYHELNELAKLMHQSLQDVKTSLQREREFVSHASHELRTPIAVIRSSMELLLRLSDDINPKANKAILRIDHASHTMTELTETLLWLGKNTKDPLHYQECKPGDVLSELYQDLHYLLDAKSVSVLLETDETRLSLPLTATKIVLGNLIRNAFQHTQEGEVIIKQQGDDILITNIDTQSSEDSLPSATGYGLGIELVKRITAQLGWPYAHTVNATGHEVRLTLVSM